MSSNATPPLEYSRALYENVLNWYRNADAKAQILLALVGGFVGFLTSSIFVKADNLSRIIACMSKANCAALGAMAATVSLAMPYRAHSSVIGSRPGW